jgi:hypothetical protein
LRTLRQSAGFGVRLAAFVVMGAALAFDKGVKVLLLVCCGLLVTMVVVIYPIYRRRGPDAF